MYPKLISGKHVRYTCQIQILLVSTPLCKITSFKNVFPQIHFFLMSIIKTMAGNLVGLYSEMFGMLFRVQTYECMLLFYILMHAY